jgi:flagellin
LSTTQTNLQNTLTQLSTGLRINSGADDAAGLAIANGMQANIAALTQSGQNATNTTGLLQTADGALSQVTSLLNRAVTLATEASTDGLTSSQSSALNSEFASIISSINSIGLNTTFNGANVFSSTAVTPFLSDGTSGNNMLGGETMSVGTLSTSGLNLNAAASNALTLSGVGTATKTFDIGGTTYTLQAAAPTVAGEVQIGATAAQTLQNLANAVNGTDGVNTANANATAGTVNTTGTSPSLTFTATTAGATGDSVVTTTTETTGTWSGGGTMTGGTAAASLDTPAAAQSALVAITNAITSVSQTRGDLGANINQLTAASNVMTSQVTNLQSADNGIMNADIGKTVANMTQYNILQSTGMSALQQSNQAQQAILKLLQ